MKIFDKIPLQLLLFFFCCLIVLVIRFHWLPLPGVPDPGTNEENVFLASFWPSLWSGMVYSIITGLVVGSVINWRERRFDARLTHQQFAREFSIASARLRLALRQPDSRLIGNAIETLPPHIAAAQKILVDSPISLWIENLPEKGQILNSISELQMKISSFEHDSVLLDTNLNVFVRNYNAGMHIQSMNDEAGRSFCVSRFQGLDTASILPWLNFGIAAAHPDRFDDIFAAAEADQDIASSAQAYVLSLQNVRASADQLRDLL